MKAAVMRPKTLLVLLIALIILGCAKRPSSQPDFTAVAAGLNKTTNVFMEIIASRKSNKANGSGIAKIGGKLFNLNVIDATLSTDLGMEDPIPQTDPNLPGLIICTPEFAELSVIVSPGGVQTTVQLNECEKDNNELFEEDGVIINPCTGEEVADTEQFIGKCLSDPEGGVEFGKDTIVLNEFNGICGADSPCVVPIDVIILVPSFQ